MSVPGNPYQIFPLGDAAVTIEFGNCIDAAINKEVIERFNQLQQQPIPGMTEAVPAYSSVTVYYDVMALKKKIPLHLTVYEWMRQELELRLQQPGRPAQNTGRLMNIPVCYEDEYAMDIHQLAATKNISIAEVIQIHTSKQYKVYMLGFLPGFAYMGELDEKIAMPRKPQPVNTAVGSVGIAGKQTGIYPLESPGGWRIIGRTPLQLFKAPPNPETSGQALPPVGGEASGEPENLETLNISPTMLRAGDTVQFYSITKNEFELIHKKSTE